MIDVSVIIVNWNGSAVLRNCLESIYRNCAGASVSFEVIVVDNASVDDSIEIMEREFPMVTVLRNNDNAGFAKANNQAFAASDGRYLLLLNNDTVLTGDALSPCVEYLDSDREVGALGCRIEFPDSSFQTSCYRFNDIPELILTRLLPLGSLAGERFNYGRYWGQPFLTPTEVDVVAGCFMMVRRETIHHVGGLDEDFFMYGEDEEWCSRIVRSKWRIVYFPYVTIIHLHRFSSRSARRHLNIVESMAPVLVLHKRRGYVTAWCANCILLFGSIIRLPLWLFVDTMHIFHGTAPPGLVQSRFAAICAHMRALFTPMWLPAKMEAESLNTTCAS